MRNRPHRWLASVTRYGWHAALAVSAALALLVGIAGITLARLSPSLGQPAHASIPDYCRMVSCDGNPGVTPTPGASLAATPKPSPSRPRAAKTHQTSTAPAPSQALPTTVAAPASQPSQPSQPSTQGSSGDGQWNGGWWDGGWWDGGQWDGGQWDGR